MADVVTTHKFVGASYVVLDLKQARYAARRGSIKVPQETRVEVLDVYCDQCKQPYLHCVSEGKPTPCLLEAHLRGGPEGTRRRRPAEPEQE